MNSRASSRTASRTTRREPRVVLPDRVPERPQRILVADDEHLVAAGLCHSLAELGYTIIGPATDGMQAIELCRTNRPDLAVLDIRMPRCDGLAAGQIIYQQMGVPVMMLTAFAEPEYVQAAAKEGVFGYLLKPVSLDQLRAAIDIAWARYIQQFLQQAKIGDLTQRLEDRKRIEQAKWILVKRRSIDEQEAMHLLQRFARNTHRTIIDVAQSVIQNNDLIDPTTGEPGPATNSPRPSR